MAPQVRYARSDDASIASQVLGDRGMPVRLEPVDGVHVTTVMDNSCDALLPDVGLVRRWGLAGTASPLPVLPSELAVDGANVDMLRAEHGSLGTGRGPAPGTGPGGCCSMPGSAPDGVIGNLDRLALPPDTVEAVVLSHGHFDHVMGLQGLARRLGARRLPVLLHPDFWTRRRIAGPDRAFELPTPSRAAIEGAGFAVIEERQASFLLDGMLLVTGEVDRETDFEIGMPPAHQAWRDGRWTPDPLVHDDQAVVLHVRDKGLVVLTGCGHAGIVNIVAHARRRTGVDRVYAVLGGFHLRGGPVVDRTVAALVELDPAVLVPAHCTSWAAQQALAAALPAAFLPNAVGSRFEL